MRFERLGHLENLTMAMTAGQFFLYLLIIIILKESLASAAPTSEASLSQSTCARVTTIPAVNMGAPSGFYRFHGFQTTKDFLKAEDYIEGADNCEPDPHIQNMVNQLKFDSSSLQNHSRSLSYSSPKLL